MRLEKYKDKRETRKKVMLIGLTVITLVSVTMMLYKTFANFRTTTSFPIMSGKVIYKKKALEFGTDIREGVGGLYKVDHGGGGLWGQSELRYAGLYPSNYVYFNCKDETTEQSTGNCELWRIIGLVNVNTSGGVTQRIKIIRNDSNGIRPDYDSMYWDKSSLRQNINNTYFNSLNNVAKEMISSDILWSYQGLNGIFTPSQEYSTLTASSSNWISGYIGLIHAYDFGYAVGGDVREWCLEQRMDYPYAQSCIGQNWLCQGADETTMDANIFQTDGAINSILSNCKIMPFSLTQSYHARWRAVVYLASNVKITGGTGTSGDPYTLSLL